ncbi:MAG TPA: serine hydrolase domain-containing protein [Lentimicrobium sp.]|nr:serine hydrolase domain-containing protein [Lentimicrobium sp.]
MKLLYRFVLITLFFFGFSAYESRITSATLNESEILTNNELNDLTRLIADEVILKIDSLVNKFSSRYRFSGNIMVAYGGSEIYSKSVGYADPLKKEPAKPETIFQLASVSKQFTAAAIMLLQSDGRLDINDSLSKYIPELPYKGVLINHLLHHISGMPNYMYLIDKYWHNEQPPDNEDAIDLMAKYKIPLFFKPGSRYDYSNTGYVLLATIVQRITGLSLNDFLQKRIFQPLGMKSTFVYSSSDSTSKRLQADGFRATKRGYVRIRDSHHDGIVGDKGVCSTTADLLKWDNALYETSLFNDDLKALVFSPAVTSAGKEIPYGCGFRLKDCNGCKVVYHNGIWEGSRTNFHRFIDSRNTIIVLNNTSISSNHELVRLIEATLNNETNLEVTSKITKLLINEGFQSAYDYYCEIQETNPFARPDIRKLMQAIEYLEKIGKETKAEEFKKLCQSMVSV